MLAGMSTTTANDVSEGFTQLDEGEQLALFDETWRSNVPLAAWQKTGPYRRTTREKAKGMPMIEANPACLQSLIVTDIDTHDIRDLHTMIGMPTPTWAVAKAGPVVTGHIAYGLTNPVCLTNAASRRPVNLLCRIEAGICDLLGGDPGYAGRIMKNPLAPPTGEHTIWGAGEGEDCRTYLLKELASPLDKLGALPSPTDPRPRQLSGVGRNVDIFNRTRAWGYRAIKRYWADDIDTWFEVVNAHAIAYNLDLEKEDRTPLPANEIHHLSRSIARWIWKRFNPETFSMIQTRRSHKGARKGGIASGKQRAEQRALLAPEVLS